MIVNGVKYDLDDLKLPSFKIAKALCEKKVGPMANGNILYLYPHVNVKKTKSGVSVPDSVLEGVASVVQESGGMVVDICPSLESNVQVKHIGRGSFVKVSAANYDIKHAFHIKEDGEIKWEAVILPAHCIVCVVPEPTYDTDIKYSPKKKQQNNQTHHIVH